MLRKFLRFIASLVAGRKFQMYELRQFITKYKRNKRLFGGKGLRGVIYPCRLAWFTTIGNLARGHTHIHALRGV